MFEVDTSIDSRYNEKLLRVTVPKYDKYTLKQAQEIALAYGFNPSTPSRMTESSSNKKWYIFTNHGIKTLFNGKTYYKIYCTFDKNGNKVAKVFYMDNTTEIIRDGRLPLSCDKCYKSLSGLLNSK